MAMALEAYVDEHGAIHDDEDCPCDDTCECASKWINDGINAAVRYLRQAAKAESA
jgi:hypothetical protein